MDDEQDLTEEEKKEIEEMRLLSNQEHPDSPDT